MIFRCGQSSRLLTIAAAVTSSKPRTSGLTAAPFSAQVELAYTFRYVRLIRFSFLILVHRSCTLEA